MIFRQSKNTFIRFWDDCGYITNQMTRHDRMYNETGADFLHEVSRQPKTIDEAIEHLQTLYGDSVSREKLRADFTSFVEDLAEHLFLISGETIEELNSKDLSLSYSMENPKTLVDELI